jgi:hypothetical protein
MPVNSKESWNHLALQLAHIYWLKEQDFLDHLINTILNWSWDSTVNIVTRLWAEWRTNRDWIPSRGKRFFSFQTSLMGGIQLTMQWVLGLKQLDHETPSPPSIARFGSGWSYIIPSPHLCLDRVHRENLPLPYFWIGDITRMSFPKEMEWTFLNWRTSYYIYQKLHQLSLI